MRSRLVHCARWTGLVAGITLGAGVPAAAETQIVGWIERVRLGDEGIVLIAKLDTGADFSSLHAVDVRWFMRDGAQWVAFEVKGADGRQATFERKVIRIAEIKRRAGGKPLERPTVLLGICLGRVYRVTEVNLADRTRFNQPMLIGRKFLESGFAVASDRVNTVEPACKGAEAK